ncbi:MAG TPA: hypothetical protein VK484_02320 [Ferruginibacter sp.]|nr:hypothetical protein [Ferruginibacter sp.]
MKKILLSIFSILVLSIVAIAQKNISYPVVVSFRSICCGVPDSKPVMEFIKSFKKQHRIKRIVVDSIGPMGKEGEYYLAFRLKELSKTQKIKFIQQLKKIAPAMKDRGSASIIENMLVDKATLYSRASIITKIL